MFVIAKIRNKKLFDELKFILFQKKIKTRYSVTVVTVPKINCRESKNNSIFIYKYRSKF